MTEELREMVYEKATHKFEAIPDNYKERIDLELKTIDELDESACILFIEKLMAINRSLQIEIKIFAEELQSSLVCYVLGIADKDPITENISFKFPEDIRNRDLYYPLESLSQIETLYKIISAKRKPKVEL